MKTKTEITKRGKMSSDASNDFRSQVREAMHRSLRVKAKAIGNNITIADMVASIASARVRVSDGGAGMRLSPSRRSHIGHEEMNAILTKLEFDGVRRRAIGEAVTGAIRSIRKVGVMQ